MHDTKFLTTMTSLRVIRTSHTATRLRLLRPKTLKNLSTFSD
jgi:hypothetical protein